MKKLLYNNYIKFKRNKSYLSDLIFGKKDYKKFVIISDSRTGSTLLRNMLNFHPRITVDGEIFKFLNSKSSEEVWNHLFRKYSKKIRYVGFKLFYFHPRTGDRKVWDILKKDSSIIVIHLIRKNILRSLVSKKIGLNTRKWTENVNSEISIPLEEKKIFLDPEECEIYFKEIAGYQEWTNSEFSNHQLISVIYEELAESKRKVIDGIYLQLGLEDFNRDSEMKKQNPERLEDLVINYEELKKEFKGSRWEYLFD